MDGAVRKAGEVVAGATRDRAAQKEADQPVAAPAPESAPEHHVHKPQPHKHSLDYVTRSFIAGGVAGCAVCPHTPGFAKPGVYLPPSLLKLI